MTLEVARIRKDFPILERKVHGRRLVYLDSAASSQKPTSVVETMSVWTTESLKPSASQSAAVIVAGSPS